MLKSKFFNIAYTVVLLVGTALLSVWVISTAYLMFHGISNNCPSNFTNPTFPNSYYSPTGTVPNPHILSGIILVIFVAFMVILVVGNIKYRSKNYKFITVALIIVIALASVEISKHTLIPSACVFNG